MTHDPNYLKDVENYFLSLAGEGVMLSSLDYGLISEWRERGIPKELVLRGIGYAFRSRGQAVAGGRGVRNLKQCAEYVESCVEDYRSTTGGHRGGEGRKKGSGILDEYIETLGRLLSEETRTPVKNFYREMRAELNSMTGEDVDILKFAAMEEKCLASLFDSLPEDDRVSIIRDAEERLGQRARHMTDEAYKESLISFRNELIRERYGIREIF